jgi:hypothetical protein
MSYQIKHNGVDISSYVHSYRRTQRICAGVGVAEITLVPTYSTSIAPYSPFEIYEDGTKKGTYFTQTISRVEPEHLIQILSQDVSKMLVDYFISESYEITEPSTAKYWIEFLLQQAHVPYTFLPDGEGHDMSINTSIGQESLLDRIQILCAENGWYFLADADNNLVIGDLELDFNNFSIAVTDEENREFNFTKNDKMLRNRVIVRGSANPYTKIWVYGEVKAITPWNYDTLDYRTTVITAPDMPNVGVATQLANQLFAETKKITEVKEVNVVGYHNAGCGDTIYINHSTFQGTGLITSISVQTVSGGATTTYIVDERCPRMFGYYRGIGDVFISTYGNGVWRKPIKYTHTWSNYSTGLANLNIMDLSVANGILACSTDTGELYTSFPTESGWVRTYLPDAVDPEGKLYQSDDMTVNSVSVDPSTGIVRAGVNYTNPNNTPSGIRSWVAEVDYTKHIEMVPITYSGVIDVGTWDLETNDYATYIQGIRGTSSSQLVVDPTKKGCLNMIASIDTLTYQWLNQDMYTGQLNTTEYIDNNDITTLRLSYSNFNKFSIYGEMLFATGDQYIHRYDLLSGVRTGQTIDLGYILDGTGYPTNHEAVFRIEAIDRTHVCIAYKKLVSGKHLHFGYFDFTDTNDITYSQTEITVPDSATKNYVIQTAVFINSDNQRVMLVHAVENQPNYKPNTYFMVYNMETNSVQVDWTNIPAVEIQVHGSIATIPEWMKVWEPWNFGTEYNFTESTYLSFNDIYGAGQLGQYKAILYGSTRYNNAFFSTTGSPPYYKQTLYNTIARQVRTIDINTGAIESIGFLPDEVLIDGVYSRPNEYGAIDIKINPNLTTTLRILCDYWKVTGPSAYTTVYTEFVFNGTNLTHTIFPSTTTYYKEKRATLLFTNNYNITVQPSTLGADTWNVSEITDTDISFYKTVVSGYKTTEIDDYNGDLLNSHYTNTVGYDAIAHIYNQDGEMVLPNAYLIGSPTVGGGYSTPVVNILGGVLLWRDATNTGNGQYNYLGFTTAVYSKNLVDIVSQGIEYPLLEYKPNSPMRLLGYSQSEYINASQTRPIVLYGGSQYYNNGEWDSFDPVDNSFSNIFVSGYVSDTTTMRYLTSDGLSTCILTCIQPPSGTQETNLWITDHDGILTSGNDYGGLVILESGIIYTDPWHTYTMSGWHTFSGIVTHVETSNYDDQPYVFVSTTVSGINHFYQLDSKKLEEANKEFTERSTNLPGATITRIRVDDRI